MSDPFTYEFRFKDREPLDCESCGYPAPLRGFEMETDGDPPLLLCELCANTGAGNVREDSEPFGNSGEVMQTIWLRWERHPRGDSSRHSPPPGANR